MQIAVVEHTAAGSYLKGALLLPLGTLDKLLMAHYLQPEEARGNRQRPEKKEQADQPEARPLKRYGARRTGAVPVGSNGCLHGESLRD